MNEIERDAIVEFATCIVVRCETLASQLEELKCDVSAIETELELRNQRIIKLEHCLAKLKEKEE